MKIGDKIIAIRKAAKLNQKDFARPLGVGASYISEIENGNKEPSDTLVSLLRAHYSISDIWWGTGEGEIFKSPTGDTSGADTAVIFGRSLEDQLAEREWRELSPDQKLEAVRLLRKLKADG